MRIVLDTASLITALRSGRGAAAEVLRLVLAGEIVMLLDYKLASEYREVSLRPEHIRASGQTREDLAKLLDVLESIAEPVYVSSTVRPLSPDPNDDMVLDLAVQGQADAIVTQNKRHFAIAETHLGIAVLIPAELLTRLQGGA